MALRSTRFVLVLMIAALTQAAFVPFSSSLSRKAFVSSSKTSTSSLDFGFLKDLGLEKPSWLPDFGGKKEEETPTAVAADGDDTTTATVADTTTDDAPTESEPAKED